jgi:hypothetical protein
MNKVSVLTQSDYFQIAIKSHQMSKSCTPSRTYPNQIYPEYLNFNNLKVLITISKILIQKFYGNNASEYNPLENYIKEIIKS